MAIATGITGAVIAAASAGYSIKHGEDMRSDARDAADKQSAEQAKLQRESGSKEDQANAQAATDQQKRKQALNAADAQVSTQGGTILTGPLGLGGAGSPSGGGKTLLGS